MSGQQQRSGGGNFQLDAGYIDVAARLVEFREKHPGGCLQPADPGHPYTVETIGDQTFIVVVAAAYRAPDDPKPGIGMAYEVFPGRTPYTRGSELQNAETSAWGRAIVAALAGDTKRGIASAEEVRNRQAERPEPPVQARLTGADPVARQQARSEARKLLAVPAAGVASEAMAMAVRAAESRDADRIVADYQAAEAKGMLDVDIRKAVHADLLDALKIEPGKPVPLKVWLTTSGKFVRANGGLSVADHARLSTEAVPS